MPRRELLTPTERVQLLAFPEDESELIRLATLARSDLTYIRQHRGDQTRRYVSANTPRTRRSIGTARRASCRARRARPRSVAPLRTRLRAPAWSQQGHRRARQSSCSHRLGDLEV